MPDKKPTKKHIALLWSRGKLVKKVIVKDFKPRIRIFDPKELLKPAQIIDEGVPPCLDQHKLLEFRILNIEEGINTITGNYEEVY